MRKPLALLGSGLLCACVLSGTYDREVARGRELEGRLRTGSARIQELEAQVRRLERVEVAAGTLSEERVQLLDELEDLRGQQQELRENLEREREVSAKATREVQDTYQSLIDELESEVAAGSLEVERLLDRVHVRAAEAILFDSGSAELKSDGKTVLERVGVELIQVAEHKIVVEGHTDPVPIATARFPSNWELSAARAARVVRALVEAGVPAARLSAVGYGAERPIASNADAAGRARNRRIEIVLIPEAGR